MTKLMILILLIALTSCNIPDVIIDAHDELQMEFDRGHCEATHYFSTFEAENGIPPLTSDGSIYFFLREFVIPMNWISSGYDVTYHLYNDSLSGIDYILLAEYDYSRFTSFHFGVIQAMKDWR